MKPQQEIAQLEADFAKPAYWRCAHCNEPITGDGWTWIGPMRKPGESVWDQKRFHAKREYPDCRRASGAFGDEEQK